MRHPIMEKFGPYFFYWCGPPVISNSSFPLSESPRLNQGHRFQIWREKCQYIYIYGDKNRKIRKWDPLVNSACIKR
jgi:hypothetical protein